MEHDAAPAAEYVPATQLEHSESAQPVLIMYFPASQLVQLTSAVRDTVDEYLPAAQLVQVAAAPAENLPATQSTQVVSAKAPVVAETLPATQFLQNVVPVASLYFPAGQLRQNFEAEAPVVVE